MPLFIGIVFAILLILGVPIGFSLGITSLFSIIKSNMPVLFNIMPQRFFSGIDMFPIMAMPFFIIAGDLMNRCKITDSLIEFSNVLVGHIRGGLAHANIVASILFAGITGAAVADSAALGSVLIPAMEKDGYDKDFSAAITAASSIIGPIIPPSTIMIIYGSIMGVSIAGLFAAGVMPGILIGLFLMLMTYFISLRRNYPKNKSRASLKEIWNTLKKSILALILPVIILGGIIGGVFTPTEAAAVSVLYAFIIGFFVTRTLKLADLPAIFLNCAKNTGIIFLIMSAASILSFFLASERIPELLSGLMLSISNNPYVVLFLINILLLIVGMFMDITAALLILAPILHPVAVNLGINPLHFAIIMIVNLNLGLMTPPLGACLFVVCGITELSLEEVAKAIWPFIVMEVAVLFIITFVPEIVMFIPRLIGIV
ncbi:TRAP transporter large permease subunit [Iocasia frigidifontis]|uniref:TRAP transporter large permease subunit n=1 Tax=Iocasia fonsfrigidae TaxID=2682810 RepID=A0A8A7KH88_9FIRM|nr:TRAP transporter large permease [Iocasia fonsfrigidae]QTL97514.1 TRAP transporter large permease subunit [Iocasia fonsfrigidae]